jgi:hypothetical protein
MSLAYEIRKTNNKEVVQKCFKDLIEINEEITTNWVNCWNKPEILKLL